jgi:hypothetical protein
MLISRTGSLMVALALAVTASATCARADDDDYKSLMADCNRADLPASDINGCIERARELDDARPSPQLQRLLTHLERRSEDVEGTDTSKSSTPASGAPHALLGATNASTLSSLSERPGAGPQSSGRDVQPREFQGPEDSQAPTEFDGGDDATPSEPAHK